MKPLAISGIESKLDRDPLTHKRAFIVKSFSTTEAITPDTRELPIEIQVFKARLSVPSLLGYLLLLLSGPLGAVLGGIMGQALLGMNICFVCLGVGTIIIRTYPRLFQRGRLLKVLNSHILSSLDTQKHTST